MIRVSELVKRFGATLAVDRVSFSIDQGEVVGFLGPNGAGKTTTIRVLTGYHPATAGTAEVAGHDVARESLAVRRQIGYLPENVPIYPDLRVVEYLRYRAALKGVPAKQRRLAVERAMAKAGIADVARKLCGHVSRGYRQRVGLADALVGNPPILILDEPTSGLDPNQRRRIKQVVRDLAADHTILFSSHILAEVQDVSSRILVIHRGRLRADGRPGELVARALPACLHVAAACDATLLRDLVLAVPGIVPDRVEITGEGAVAAEVRPEQDPRADVGQRAQRAGLSLRDLRLEVPTLEEFFAAVTEGADHEETAEPALPTAAGGAR
jgi:ABC-2 type transport system ATP-binding protein